METLFCATAVWTLRAIIPRAFAAETLQFMYPQLENPKKSPCCRPPVARTALRQGGKPMFKGTPPPPPIIILMLSIPLGWGGAFGRRIVMLPGRRDVCRYYLTALRLCFCIAQPLPESGLKTQPFWARETLVQVGLVRFSGHFRDGSRGCCARTMSTRTPPRLVGVWQPALCPHLQTPGRKRCRKTMP